MQYLLIDVPLWSTIVTFAVGWCLGWFVRGIYDGSSKEKRIGLEKIVQLCVVFLWIAAMSRAIFFDSFDYPPPEVSILFGAAAGTMNRQLGDQIVKVLKVLMPFKK